MDRVTLAAAQDHSLADISTLPWWVQLIIGLGLVAIGMLFSWIAKRGDEGTGCLASCVAFATGLAGLLVLISALFGWS
jgi:hypothetical protein